MKLLVLCAFLAVAAADYHDDVFHFTTLKGPISPHQVNSVAVQAVARPYSGPSSKYTQSRFAKQYSGQYTPVVTKKYSVQPVYTQVVQPVYTQFQEPTVVVEAPSVTEYVHQVQQVPAVTQYQQVHQVHQVPAVSQYQQVHQVQQVPAVRQYQVQVPQPRSYAPAYQGGFYRILKHVQEVDPAGPYRASYATENGISANEEGSLVSAPEGPAVAKQGSYSYTGPDGVVYTVNWIADENGFRASGAHLPTPPPSS